jgi:hypothetical protein
MAPIEFSPRERLRYLRASQALEQTKVMQLASFAEPAGQRSSAARTFA